MTGDRPAQTHIPTYTQTTVNVLFDTLTIASFVCKVFLYSGKLPHSFIHLLVHSPPARKRKRTEKSEHSSTVFAQTVKNFLFKNRIFCPAKAPSAI